MSIEARLRLIGPALVLSTAALVGFSFYWGYRAIVMQERLDGLAALVEADAGRVALAIEATQNDALMLAELPAVRNLVNARVSRTGEDLEYELDQAAGVFRALLIAHASYDQVRIISADDGSEVIRVHRDGAALVRVPADELQPKGDSDYFDEILRLDAGQIYVSPISLNRELGHIEIPHRPMVRVATPLHSDTGEAFGFVIINIAFDRLVTDILGYADEGFRYYLTNEAGDFLHHPDPSRAFGFDLGRRDLLQHDYPELAPVLERGRADAAGAVAEIPSLGQTALIYAQRIHPFVSDPERFLTLAIAGTFDVLAAPSPAIVSRVVIVTISMLILAAVSAYYLTAGLVRPLKDLTAVADRITQGEVASFEHVDRDDEIGKLSGALEHMVRALREHRESLTETLRDLQHFSKLASHDLTEPARRVSALASLLASTEQKDLSGESRQILSHLQAEGQNIVRQLSDIRAFARIGEYGQFREEADIGEIAKRALAIHTARLTERDVVPHVAPLPRAKVYANLVELLYGHLIQYILDATGDERIELHFGHEHRAGDDVLTIGTQAAEPGAPMPEQTIPESEEHESRLVLGICQRIVERHSGSIWSQIDSGRIRFWFTLGGSSE